MLISSPQCTAVMHGCGWLRAVGAVGHILFLQVYTVCVVYVCVYTEDTTFTVNKTQIAWLYCFCIVSAGIMIA